MIPSGIQPALLAVAAYGLKGTLREFPAEPLSDRDWSRMIEHVRTQRLSGLLMAAVDDGALPVTDTQRESARDEHVAAMTHVLLLEDFLINSVKLLSDAGIRTRILKGSAVAHLDYGDPSLRPFVDIDLLVESHAFDDAMKTLFDAGHRRYFAQIHPDYDRRFGKGASLVSPDGLELDLHRTFAMGPFGLTVDLDSLWESEQRFGLGATQLSALGPEERLLHACYHASLGDWPPRLLPHRDVAEMLLYGNCEEERLLRLSAQWGGSAVVARAIATAWTLFDIADVTALSAWALRYRIDARDRNRLGVYTDGNTSFAAKTLASIRSLPKLRDRLALIRMLAWPKEDFMVNRDSSRVHWVVASLRRATGRSTVQSR